MVELHFARERQHAALSRFEPVTRCSVLLAQHTGVPQRVSTQALLAGFDAGVGEYERYLTSDVSRANVPASLLWEHVQRCFQDVTISICEDALPGRVFDFFLPDVALRHVIDHRQLHVERRRSLETTIRRCEGAQESVDYLRLRLEIESIISDAERRVVAECGVSLSLCDHAEPTVRRIREMHARGYAGKFVAAYWPQRLKDELLCELEYAFAA